MDFNSDDGIVEHGVDLEGRVATRITPKKDMAVATAYSIDNRPVTREQYFDMIENGEFESDYLPALPALSSDPHIAEKQRQQRTCGGDTLFLYAGKDLS